MHIHLFKFLLPPTTSTLFLFGLVTCMLLIGSEQFLFAADQTTTIEASPTPNACTAIPAYEAAKLLTTGFVQEFDPALTPGYIEVNGNFVKLLSSDAPDLRVFLSDAVQTLEYNFTNNNCWAIPDEYYNSYWKENTPEAATTVTDEKTSTTVKLNSSAFAQKKDASQSASITQQQTDQLPIFVGSTSDPAGQMSYLDLRSSLLPVQPQIFNGDPTFVQPSNIVLDEDDNE